MAVTERRSDRAVSTTVSYVTTLAITTVLISGLMISAGGFVEGQRERVVRSELDVLAEQTAADLAAADRLNASTPNATVHLRTRLPSRVGDRPYTVTIREVAAPADRPNTYAVRAHTASPNVSVTATVRTEGTLVETSVSGGSLTVVGDGTPLEVRNG